MMAARGVSRLDDGVLREEAGKADAERRRRSSASVPIIIMAKVKGMSFRKPAHRAHVLLVMHRMDDRACAEEEQRLEEGVGKEVEHAGE